MSEGVTLQKLLIIETRRSMNLETLSLSFDSRSIENVTFNQQKFSESCFHDTFVALY